MYSVSSYGRMIADKVRTEAYLQALRQVVNSDSVVLDLGTGIGIFGILACQLGVRRVYAIEPDDAIQLAREIARANHFSDRIVFIQDLSNHVTLPERADVIITDLHGVLPLYGHLIPSIADARKRLLVPDGVLIPQTERLWISLVEAPDLYLHHTVPWGNDVYGLNVGPWRRIVTNTWRKAHVKPEQLLVEPRCWATLDYSTMSDPNLSANTSWIGKREGTAHGIVVWFDSQLGDGVGFSNAPGAPELIYGNAFFPLLAPLTIVPGDVVTVQLDANLVGEDYVWRWQTRVQESNGGKRLKANFKQSTFFGAPLTSERLRKRSAAHVPVLNDDGKLKNLILSLMNGQMSLEQIAQQLTLQFPERFSEWQDALDLVGQTSQKYSQ